VVEKLFSVPLDDLVRDPACVIDLAPEALAALATKLVAAQFAVVNEQARRFLIGRGEAPPARQDRLLTAEEAAPLLALTVEQVKRHRFPFTRKLGHKTVRYSETGLRRWVERQRAA
jgi:predicted DNA-binding transcriptional regulator AlpA